MEKSRDFRIQFLKSRGILVELRDYLVVYEIFPDFRSTTRYSGSTTRIPRDFHGKFPEVIFDMIFVCGDFIVIFDIFFCVAARCSLLGGKWL